ncbi:TetR/AcrR family transcriptional regulator [Pseudarthrobacter sp. J1763]|uniref:TetR/AcrR family transcriptional regulator n=1 Tax=Pseudarthrobacter sp. J1763 TaxID=3420445 RepID=UPI003D27CD4A
MPELENDQSPRNRILEAATSLLRESGRDAVSTRSVSAAAGVQPQTIYRQYGDKAGLLDAVVAEGFREYIASKTARPRSDDPVEDLRSGWDLHIAFGCENPALYVLMYGEPDASRPLTSAGQAADILRELVEAVARAGRLRVDVETAAAMIHSAGVGVVLTLVAQQCFAVEGLADSVREAVIAAITTDAESKGARGTSGSGTHAPNNRAASNHAAKHAIALRASLGDAADSLSPGEALLLDELLRKIAAS